VTIKRSVFWDDLSHDLEDPEFRREFVLASVRIATVDRVIGALDEARESKGLTKADLARTIGAEPAVVRRLFSAGNANPTLGTLAAVAAALGFKVTIEPLADPAEHQVEAALRENDGIDLATLSDHLIGLRAPATTGGAEDGIGRRG
jgi:transcriptional regulator with XRE-family HTH domain